MNSSTTTPFRKVLASSVLFAGAALMALSTPLSVFGISVAELGEQIRQKEAEVGQYQAEAGRLQAQADTLQNKINAINAQKQAIQAQIDLNQAKHDQLVAEIDETQKKIDKQKEILGDTLANLYVDAEVSSLELIASSSSIGDYMDKQEYRSAIRDKLNQSIKKVRELRQQLSDKKVEVERVLADQQAQRQMLAAQEAEQARLLEQTRGEEAAYQNLIAQRSSEISSLQAQQAALNARFTGGAAGSGPACGGGYPARWCEIPMDSAVDSWGMYNRQCVSYTAWKVASTGRYMPYWGGIGNANQWDDNARAQGIPTGSTPQPGSVAISNAGYYGHAMYVESVNSDGSINISQYNAGWDGRYSTATIEPYGLVFIYF